MKKSIIKKANAQRQKVLEKTTTNKTKDKTSNKIVITDKQKYDRKGRFNYILYSSEKADAFNYIISLLKITPFTKQYGKLPISNSNFYNIKSSKKKGQDFSISVDTINKMADYFSLIINDRYNTLSSEEQENLRKSFETFSDQSFPELNFVPAKDQSGKVTKEKEVKPGVSKSSSSKSIVLTLKASMALKNLCEGLKLKSQYYQKGGVPVSVFTLFYWTKPTSKGVSQKKLFPVLDYFKDIIKNGNSKNLSDEDWNKIKKNWKILSFEVSKMKDHKEVSKQEITGTPVPNLTNEKIIDSNEENDEKEFVLNYRYYIQKKQESDRKLEEILERRVQERYNRDKLLKIQDALKDIPILSTLALSKEKQFSEKVYEIKDFVISNKRGKTSGLEDMKQVVFISENPDVSLSKSLIFLNEDEYKQYQVIKGEAEKDQGKVEVKLILGNDGKLNLYFCFSF